MPARRLSIRKLQEVLRLRFEPKLGYQQIGRSCAIGVSTDSPRRKSAYSRSVSFGLGDLQLLLHDVREVIDLGDRAVNVWRNPHPTDILLVGHPNRDDVVFCP